jgi:hypothetical protein
MIKETDEDWDSLAKESESIDDFYNSNLISVPAHYPNASDLLDSYSNDKGSSMLSLYEWSKLHLNVHRKVINYHSVYTENVELKTKLSLLKKDVNRLKNTLIENKTNIIYLNTYYS